MVIKINKSSPVRQTVIKKCHVCGHIIESTVEAKQCPKCHKYFLPLNYMKNTEEMDSTEFYESFASGHELNESDIIKGIYVLW